MVESLGIGSKELFKRATIPCAVRISNHPTSRKREKETRVHLTFIYELTSHPGPSNTARSRYHPHHRSSFGPFFTSPCPPAPSGLRPKADHELLHVADPALNPLHDGAEAAHVGAENTARSFSSCNHMPHFSNPIFSMSSIHPQWRGGRTCIFALYSDHSIYIITRYIK
jgi:hypothetical protein